MLSLRIAKHQRDDQWECNQAEFVVNVKKHPQRGTTLVCDRATHSKDSKKNHCQRLGQGTIPKMAEVI